MPVGLTTRNFHMQLFSKKTDNRQGFGNPTGTNHKHVNWPFRPERCPCDVDFIAWLKKTGTSKKRLFHMGTGLHHTVGLDTLNNSAQNHVLGVTIGPKEHQNYIKLIHQHPKLAQSYKVLFADIYSLSHDVLPPMDVIALFHLCEFFNPHAPSRLHDDASLLNMFMQLVQPGGYLLFYTGSNGWKQDINGPSAESLITALISQGILRAHTYRSLLICQLTQ